MEEEESNLNFYFTFGAELDLALVSQLYNRAQYSQYCPHKFFFKWFYNIYEELTNLNSKTLSKEDKTCKEDTHVDEISIHYIVVILNCDHTFENP